MPSLCIRLKGDEKQPSFPFRRSSRSSWHQLLEDGLDFCLMCLDRFNFYYTSYLLECPITPHPSPDEEGRKMTFEALSFAVVAIASIQAIYAVLWASHRNPSG